MPGQQSRAVLGAGGAVLPIRGPAGRPDLMFSLCPSRFKLLSQEEGEYFNVPVPPEGEEGNEELRQKFEVSWFFSGTRAFCSLPAMSSAKGFSCQLLPQQHGECGAGYGPSLLPLPAFTRSWGPVPLAGPSQGLRFEQRFQKLFSYSAKKLQTTLKT